MLSLAVLLLLSSWAIVPVAAASNDPTVDPAIAWLQSQQQPDGGFLGFSGKSDPSTTTDIVVALAATGDDPTTIANGGPSAVDYLRSQTATYASTTGGAAKLTLAVVAAGLDPRDFGGKNLVRDILRKQDPSDGLFDPQLYVHAYSMLALSAAGQTVPASAVVALEQHQAVDGGWAFTGETAAGKSDSNTTAVAIEALVASGHRSSVTISKGKAYLASLKDPNGLYASQPVTGGPLVGDANSTALVVQAMLATGSSADSADVSNAIAALDKLTNPSGAFYYRTDVTDDNLLATAQAIPAIEGKPLPIWPVHAPGRTLEQAKAKAEPGDAQRCAFFPQTGHNACQGFLAYWKHFGGLDVFGYPLTEEFTTVDPATGQPTTVQYFERVRFEWHPGSAPQRYDVQLGRIGSEQLSAP